MNTPDAGLSWRDRRAQRVAGLLAHSGPTGATGAVCGATSPGGNYTCGLEPHSAGGHLWDMEPMAHERTNQ